MNAVTVVIPHWNRADLLRSLLPQLNRQTLRPAAVLVVDNGSTDGSAALAASLGADVIALPSNQGFAAAVNAGVRAAATPLVAVLNNDLHLHPDWLALLAAALENPSFAFACGKILSLHQPHLLDGAFDLLSFAACPWRAGHAKLDSPLWDEPCLITSPPFAAVLLRRDVFLSLQGLDERFGSYLEDVSFGLQAALAGYRGIYVPAAVCHHAGSATLGPRSSAVVYLLSRNQIFLLAKHFPSALLRRRPFKILCGQLLWALLAARQGHLPAWLRGKFHGLRAWKTLRHPPPSPDTLSPLLTLLASQERLIARLQASTCWDAYWRWYFRLTGVPPQP